MERNNDSVHIIDITRNADALSGSSQPPGRHLAQHEYQTSGGTQVSTYSFASRGGAGHGHGQSLRIWFYNFKLVLCLSEIIASVVVLSLSRNENPHAPLFAWLVVYAFVDVAALPIRIYSRYRNRNQGTDNNNNPESINQVSVRRNNNTPLAFSSRLNGLVSNFSMVLDCFLHVWFVVGTVWIFGGHSSASDAPKLYRLCVVLLAIGYFLFALEFVIFCGYWLPCIIWELDWGGSSSN